MSLQLIVCSIKFKSKSFVWVIGVCLLSVFSFISTISFSLVSLYETKASQITVDNFSNFYTASNNRIIKFSPDGKFISLYEEFKYGKIGTVDVNNPMKILVFYPDFLTAVVTDRFLAPLNSYNFFDFGYQNITAVASSVDGRIWFYDNIDFKLKKIDEAGKIIRESQPLNVILEQSPVPNFMIERDNKVYLNDPDIGILVFDIFGSYSKTIPLKGVTRFQVLQEQIVYYESKQLNSYNPLTLESKIFQLPDTLRIISAVLEKDRLAVLKNDRVEFYKY